MGADGQGNTGGSGKMQIKVYIVLQRVNLPRPGEPNVRIVATRLTRGAAQALVDHSPGCYIEKQVALK
jgi:hypothetical protein